MTGFIAAFADELTKLGAFKYDVDQNIRPDFAKSMTSMTKKLQPAQKPKADIPNTPLASRPHAINPLTSPNALTEQ